MKHNSSKYLTDYDLFFDSCIAIGSIMLCQQFYSSDIAFILVIATLAFLVFKRIES